MSDGSVRRNQKIIRAILLLNIVLLWFDSSRFGLRLYQTAKAHIHDPVSYVAAWIILSSAALLILSGFQVVQVMNRRESSKHSNGKVRNTYLGVWIDSALVIVWTAALFLLSARAAAGVL